MKILFITKGENLDYENDCLFHGLCQLDGVECYLLKEHSMDYMFEGGFSPESLASLYGKGFTIANRISPAKKKIHTILQAKANIVNHYYDLVIYGSIFRCSVLLNTVLQYYGNKEIFFVDGEDDNNFPKIGRGLPYRLKRIYYIRSLAEKGIFFKRELLPCFSSYIQPISFAIPDSCVVAKIPEKKTNLAFIVPGKTETYIYTTEQSYYQGYQEAKFAITKKKAGWDCLRHYEILANGCIPYFKDINKLPSSTMVFFPKNLIRMTNHFYETGISDNQYSFYCTRLLEHTRNYLTTTRLAEYVLSFRQH